MRMKRRRYRHYRRNPYLVYPIPIGYPLPGNPTLVNPASGGVGTIFPTTSGSNTGLPIVAQPTSTPTSPPVAAIIDANSMYSPTIVSSQTPYPVRRQMKRGGKDLRKQDEATP
jgi:hypothetical protein